MDDETKRWDTLGHIPNLLNLVQSSVQFWGPVCGGVVAYFFHAPWYIIVSIMIAVFILSCILIERIRLALKELMLSLAHGLLPMDKTYECRNKVTEYTYENRETMTFRVSYDVKIHSGSHNYIPERVKWSAGDLNVDDFSSIVERQDISPGPPDEKRDTLIHLGFQGFRIVLPKTYTKQDRPFPTGYYCVCPPDPNHKAIPCLAICVYQKVNRLTLRVRFERSLVITNIRKQKFARYLDEVPYKSEFGKLKPDRDPRFFCVEFEIKHPIPGAKYAIDWEFSES